MEQDNRPNKNNEPVYSKKLRAGRRRTYFFDVRTTRSNDYYLTITESKKKFNDDGYERHKVFLYKEDFNKFVEALQEIIEHVKTELMPEYDFDEFSHREEEGEGNERFGRSERYESPAREDTQPSSPGTAPTPGDESSESSGPGDTPHSDEDEEALKW